jgi:REP element-mobilizing transposase RayT
MQPHYQTRNTRKGRHSESGQIYLLTAITKDREPFFSDWRIGAFVARQFEQADRDHAVDSLAWVVMPDHFHWLIALTEKPLSEVIARAKSKGNYLVNKSLARTGSIWQRGFHDRALRREEDLKAVARYVILNPVRAGLVRRVGDYPLWNAVWI